MSEWRDIDKEPPPWDQLVQVTDGKNNYIALVHFLRFINYKRGDYTSGEIWIEGADHYFTPTHWRLINDNSKEGCEGQ